MHTRRVSVLDSLVGTILSQNTTDKTSHKAFASLKRSFPTWESVRTGDPTKVAESIKVGGLSEIKTGRIQNILQVSPSRPSPFARADRKRKKGEKQSGWY